MEKQRILDKKTISGVEHPDIMERVIGGKMFDVVVGSNFRKIEIGGLMGETPDGKKVSLLFEDHGRAPDGTPQYKYVGYTIDPEAFSLHKEQVVSKLRKIG